MKYSFLFLALLLMLASCGRHQLKIVDLRLNDIESEAIVKNRVDTMFLISNRSFSLVTASGIKDCSSSDTIGYQAYDCIGNVLAQSENRNDGNHVSCEYDSLGLLRHKKYHTDHQAEYDLRYKFDSDSRVLQQFWTGKTNDTSVFKFDARGYLLEETSCGDVDSGREFHYKTSLAYNEAGQLIQKKRDLLVSAEMLQRLEQLYKRPISNQDTTDFYYVNNKLDNSVSTFCFPNHPDYNYSSKTYYDDRGLPIMTTHMGASVICYAYTTRSND